MIRRASVPAILLFALLAGACAPKGPPVPPAITAPVFPEFVFPAAPGGLGTPAARERHDVAWRWLQAGDLRAAERNFASALRQSASFYPAEVGLGYVELARRNYKESLQHFDRAVVANPRYAPALAGRGEAFLAMGETDRALESIETALAADPALATLRSRAEVLRFRRQQQEIAGARKFAAAGRWDEARAAYRAAIGASPESPFLHRELADVERRAGDLEAALQHARRAAELDPDDQRAHLLAGEILEAQGNYSGAIDEYTTAFAIAPDEALSDRIEALRSRVAYESMPPEYRAIQTSPTITRAQLAALLAVRLENVLSRARRVDAVVITDTRGSWASSYILTVARAGVMEVYPNHTFQPNAIVRRADLAHASSRVLELIAAQRPLLAASWRKSRRTFPDVGTRHLSYPAAALAVEAGVMSAMADGTFQLTRSVTGADAIAAVRKLEELAAQPPQ